MILTSYGTLLIGATSVITSIDVLMTEKEGGNPSFFITGYGGASVGYADFLKRSNRNKGFALCGTIGRCIVLHRW